MTPEPIGLNGNGHAPKPGEPTCAIASDEPAELQNPRQRAALEAILSGCRWGEVARRAGVSRTTLLKWRHDPVFIENVALERRIRQEWCETHETVVRYEMAQHSLDAVSRVRSIMDGEMPTKVTSTRGGDTIHETDAAAVGAQLKAAQAFLPKASTVTQQTNVQVNVGEADKARSIQEEALRLLNADD